MHDPFAILREPSQLEKEAGQRRAALVEFGCATFRLIWTQERRAILCLCCGMWSFNTGDIREKYCGFCHCYQSDWKNS